jgi:flagellar biosynthesis protein FlhF
MRLRRITAADEIEAAARAGAPFFGGLVLREGAARPDSYLALAEVEPGAGVAPADWLDEPQALITEILALHQVPAPLAERIVFAVARSEHRAVGDPVGDLAAGLAACLPFARLAGPWCRGSVALVGPPGAGKTTLAAKLAARVRRVRPLLLDAAGGSQLAEYAEALGATLRPALDPAALAGTPRRAIIDMPGINPHDGAALRRTAELLRAARAEPILVLPADLGAADAAATARAFGPLSVRKLVVTRLDVVRRLGGVLAAAAAGGCDLVAASVTPHFAYGLRPLSPVVLARRLLSAAIDGRRWRVG